MLCIRFPLLCLLKRSMNGHKNARETHCCMPGRLTTKQLLLVFVLLLLLLLTMLLPNIAYVNATLRSQLAWALKGSHADIAL